MNLVSVRCNLCGADDYKVLYRQTLNDEPPTVEDYTSTAKGYGLFHRIVRCSRCGLIYMNPRDAQIKEFYRKVVDDGYVESWRERAATFRRHLKALGRYKKKGGRLLDIGCYAGVFPDEAIKAGYDVTAIEPSKWAVEFAVNKTHARILEGCWDEVHFPDNHFDVITMWDVIEHLEDPSSCLGRVSAWLKEDGIVAITTHNIKGIFARLTGRSYPWLMRFHLYHFEPRTLKAMLLKKDLEPLLTRYYVKTFSLKYLLGRFGIETRNRLLEALSVPLNTGDMFMVVARKRCA